MRSATPRATPRRQCSASTRSCADGGGGCPIAPSMRRPPKANPGPPGVHRGRRWLRGSCPAGEAPLDAHTTMPYNSRASPWTLLVAGAAYEVWQQPSRTGLSPVLVRRRNRVLLIRGALPETRWTTSFWCSESHQQSFGWLMQSCASWIRSCASSAPKRAVLCDRRGGRRRRGAFPHPLDAHSGNEQGRAVSVGPLISRRPAPARTAAPRQPLHPVHRPWPSPPGPTAP